MNQETNTPPATNVKPQAGQTVVSKAAPAQIVAAPPQQKKEFVAVAAPKSMTIIEASEAIKNAEIVHAVTPNTKKG